LKISPTQSDFLNLSRWVAAWLVVAEHARSLVFMDYGHLAAPDLLTNAFYFFTGFGHEAVVIFFVISGFLVGGKAWALSAQGRFSWRRYLADRTSRLYAVLLAALALGAGLDAVGLHFFNRYGLYDMSHEGAVAVVTRSVRETLTWEGFLANALFLQTIVAPPLGSNGPLWSLAYEWWYYILLPAVASLIFRQSKAAVITGLLLTLFLWMLLPEGILRLFGVWFLGVGASLWQKRAPPWWLAGSVLVLILVLVRADRIQIPLGWEYGLGAAFMLALVSLAGRETRLPGADLSARLADFSYSVYLTHFPVLMVSVSAAFTLMGYGIKEPFGWQGINFYVTLFAGAISAAWAISRGTEAKTNILRMKLYKWIKVLK